MRKDQETVDLLEIFLNKHYFKTFLPVQQASIKRVVYVTILPVIVLIIVFVDTVISNVVCTSYIYLTTKSSLTLTETLICHLTTLLLLYIKYKICIDNISENDSVFSFIFWHIFVCVMYFIPMHTFMYVKTCYACIF